MAMPTPTPDESFDVEGWRVSIFVLPDRASGWTGYFNVSSPTPSIGRERTVVNKSFPSKDAFINVAVDQAIARVNELRGIEPTTKIGGSG